MTVIFNAIKLYLFLRKMYKMMSQQVQFIHSNQIYWYKEKIYRNINTNRQKCILVVMKQKDSKKGRVTQKRSFLYYPLKGLRIILLLLIL